MCVSIVFHPGVGESVCLPATHTMHNHVQSEIEMFDSSCSNFLLGAAVLVYFPTGVPPT